MYLVYLVLDEVDQLESRNQDVVYTVFEWPALSASRLSLVGIANTLDLMDRVLPGLQVQDTEFTINNKQCLFFKVNILIIIILLRLSLNRFFFFKINILIIIIIVLTLSVNRFFLLQNKYVK